MANLNFENRDLVRIAIKTSSPEEAKKIAEKMQLKKGQALAVMVLSRIRRDYPENFWKMDSVVEVFEELSRFEKKHILKKMPEKIRKNFEIKIGG